MSLVRPITCRQAANFLLVAVLVFPAMTGGAAAQELSGNVVVEAGETVDGIDAVTGSVVVRGTVTGGVNGAAGTIHVAESGHVEGSIGAAAGDVRIDGTVEGDVNAGSGRVELSETGWIGGDLSVGAESVIVDGQVDGDVRAGAERIVLGPNAVVGGEFRYDADEFVQNPGATVEGGVVHDPSIRGDIGVFAPPNWAVRVYGLLANLLLGALLLVVFPSFSSGVASRVADRPVETGAVGLLTLLAVPLLLVAFAITIIGIPITVLGAIAFGFAVWIAVVYGQYAVGVWVLRRAGRDNRWLALVAGLVGFTVFGVIPILGGLLEFGAFLLGFGGLALGLRESYRARRGARPHSRQTTFDDQFGETRTGSDDQPE